MAAPSGLAAGPLPLTLLHDVAFMCTPERTVTMLLVFNSGKPLLMSSVCPSLAAQKGHMCQQGLLSNGMTVNDIHAGLLSPSGHWQQ